MSTAEACLVKLNAPRKNPYPALPVLALYITRWDPAPTEPVKGVTLTLFECDYPDESLRTKQEPTKATELLKVVFDLVPSVPATTADDAKDHKGCAPVLSVAAKPKARVTKGATRKGTFVLLLSGEKDAYLQVAIPADAAAQVHAEGEFHEIGMTLEHETLDAPVKRLTSDRVAASWLPYDSLKTVLGLSVPIKGAIEHDREFVAERTVEVDDPKKKGAKVKKVLPLGRFNDPARTPSVQPEKAAATLDAETITALKTHAAKPVNLDGLRFRNFVAPAKRQAVIKELAAAVKLKKHLVKVKKDGKWVTEERDPSEWKTTDLQKAFFVVHDVGDRPGSIENVATRYPYPLAASQKKGVSGFVNTDGSYAIASDFEQGGWGTVFSGTGAAGSMARYFIDIESVLDGTKSDGSLTVPAYLGADTKKNPEFASLAYSGDEVNNLKGDWTGYSKWTHDTLDTLALLYVLASARADHLLTVTAHVEADRSLFYSRVFFMESAASLYAKRDVGRGVTGFWKLLHAPYNAHGDPTGLNFQIFYDKITAILDGLRAKHGGTITKLPATGLRYGIDPARITYTDGRLRTYGNSSGHLNTFPHQSGRLRTTKDLDAAGAKLYRLRYDNDGTAGKGGPWWHPEFESLKRTDPVTKKVHYLNVYAEAARKKKEAEEAAKKAADDKAKADAAAKKPGAK